MARICWGSWIRNAVLLSTVAPAALGVSAERVASRVVPQPKLQVIGPAHGPDRSREIRVVSAEEPAPSAGSPSAAQQPPLSPGMQNLRNKVRRVLAMYYPKHQVTRDNTTWEVMHEIIAYGVHAQLYRDSPRGPKVNAIGWLCFNGPCKGEQLMYLDRGQLVARKGVGLQGHFGQFLAILAQSKVKLDYPMQIGGKSFTVADLVKHEQQDCQAGEELTFKLIGLAHYLDSDATWTSRDGQTWSIQRLITEELKQPIRGAACGGTHRLMGFAYAVNRRVKQGKPVTGEFARAEAFTKDYQRYTFALQNPDGCFSTQWFVRKEANPDVDRRLKTSGHILEYLAFSLSDEQLRDPRMVKAVDQVASILMSDPKHEWEIGPIGHGLHALAIYDARVFGPKPASVEPLVRLPVVSLPTLKSPPAAGDPGIGDPGIGNASPQGVAPADAADDVTPQDADASDEEYEVDASRRSAIEVAEKTTLRWTMPPCEIGNDCEPGLPEAPDRHIPPGDADDEGCL